MHEHDSMWFSGCEECRGLIAMIYAWPRKGCMQLLNALARRKEGYMHRKDAWSTITTHMHSEQNTHKCLCAWIVWMWYVLSVCICLVLWFRPADPASFNILALLLHSSQVPRAYLQSGRNLFGRNLFGRKPEKRKPQTTIAPAKQGCNIRRRKLLQPIQLQISASNGQRCRINKGLLQVSDHKIFSFWQRQVSSWFEAGTLRLLRLSSCLFGFCCNLSKGHDKYLNSNRD